MEVETLSLKESKRVPFFAEMKLCCGFHWQVVLPGRSLIIYGHALFILMLTHEPQKSQGHFEFFLLGYDSDGQSFPPHLALL